MGLNSADGLEMIVEVVGRTLDVMESLLYVIDILINLAATRRGRYLNQGHSDIGNAITPRDNNLTSLPRA